MINFAMTIRIYVRASTKEQDAERALAGLIEFSRKASQLGGFLVAYASRASSNKLAKLAISSALSRTLTHRRALK